MDPYNVLSKLGRGTFGTVYLCERKHNSQKIVIKEINVDLNNETYNAVKNEISIMKSLDHPNVIAYFDSYWKNESFFIVMEYASAGNLQELISNAKPHFFPRQFVLATFCQILLALDHIHQKKIIHRDLKSENIFLTGLYKDIVKIGDFGISKTLQNMNSKTNTVIGTTNYLAPEMCDGKSYDSKSDIWSLGCILYELCALERMFEGSVSNVVTCIKSGIIKQINMKRYGRGLQNVINITVQQEPSKRPSTIDLMSAPQLMAHVQVIGLNMGLI